MKNIRFFKLTELPETPVKDAVYFIKQGSVVKLYVTDSEGEPEPVAVDDVFYTHTQVSASNSWVIIHNLGKKPSVTIVDSGDNVVIGDVIYNSVDQLTVNFSAAFSGKAYLN